MLAASALPASAEQVSAEQEDSESASFVGEISEQTADREAPLEQIAEPEALPEDTTIDISEGSANCQPQYY